MHTGKLAARSCTGTRKLIDVNCLYYTMCYLTTSINITLAKICVATIAVITSSTGSPSRHWQPWGRPPFWALVQLCFGIARDLSVAITYLLSNRAEKPVSRPPGPCCTLKCAVPSRRVGSSRNRCMRPRPAGRTGSPPALGGCNWSQPVRLCSRCREVVPMHVGALCGGRADRQRAEGCG